MRPFIAILALTILSFDGLEAGTEQTCLDCHGPKENLTSEQAPASSSIKETQNQEESSEETSATTLHSSIINLTALQNSPHGDFDCLDCHTDADEDHTDSSLAPVDCSECHEDAQEAFSNGIHSQAMALVGKEVRCTSCHGTHDILPPSDKNSSTFALNLPKTCGKCHGEKKEPGVRNAVNYFSSIHYDGLKNAGLIVSANCTSCHGSHDILKRTDINSPVNRFKVAGTCGKCHEGAYEDWKVSVHGKAFLDGDLDAPVCTHCHGEHGIKDRNDPTSRVYALSISKSTCTPCHGPERIQASDMKVSSNNTQAYEDSFHGLAAQFGDPTVANCASCHGAHKILKSSDPQSSVNPKNLPQTCGECHPGAGENFAVGSIHSPTSTESTGGKWLVGIRIFYIFLITMTLLIMFGHNFLDYLKKLREYNKAVKKGWKHERFVPIERIQHLMMVISFFALVITGFALKYPDAFWVQPLIDFKMGFLVRAYGHRIAALIFIGLSAAHLYYLAFTKRGRGQVKSMWPQLKDAKDMIHQMRYYFDLEKKPGNFGRYSYVEKMEYLALIWGSIVMVVTGLILWFEESALLFMPKWGWDISEMVHLYEAWLATLSIIVWHFYHVLFKPGAHEYTLAMVTGELSEGAMKHEHPEQYEELKAQSQDDKPIEQHSTEEKEGGLS